MKKEIEIYFNDLTEDAQARVMAGMGISDSADGNFEIAPLTILDFEEDTE